MYSLCNRPGTGGILRPEGTHGGIGGVTPANIDSSNVRVPLYAKALQGHTQEAELEGQKIDTLGIRKRIYVM